MAGVTSQPHFSGRRHRTGILSTRVPVLTSFLRLARQTPKFLGRRHRVGILFLCAPLLAKSADIPPTPLRPKLGAIVTQKAKAVALAGHQRRYRSFGSVSGVGEFTLATTDPRAPHGSLVLRKARTLARLARGRTGTVSIQHGPLATALYSTITRPHGAMVTRKARQVARAAHVKRTHVLIARGPKATALFSATTRPHGLTVTRKARTLARLAKGRRTHGFDLKGPTPGTITTIPLRGTFTGGPYTAVTWQGGPFTSLDFTGGPFTRVTWSGDP